MLAPLLTTGRKVEECIEGRGGEPRGAIAVVAVCVAVMCSYISGEVRLGYSEDYGIWLQNGNINEFNTLETETLPVSLQITIEHKNGVYKNDCIVHVTLCIKVVLLLSLRRRNIGPALSLSLSRV